MPDPFAGSEDDISFLGVDIGGTKVAVRIESAKRPPFHTAFSWSGLSTTDQDLEMLVATLKAVREQLPEPVEAVGVAMPATLDATGRVLAWPSRPHWVGVNLPAVVHTALPGARVRWADDGDLAAVAEGEVASCADLLYVGVGTGVGGGILLGGLPVPGIARGSCEVGHVIVDRNGPVCACGRRGCVQAVASGPATLRAAARLRGRTETAFADLRAAYEAGESWAVSAIHDACAALAAAIVSIAELVRPDLVSIGGGFATGIPGYVDATGGYVTTLSRPGSPPPPVRQARLGGLSSLYGAVLLARAADGDTLTGP